MVVNVFFAAGPANWADYHAVLPVVCRDAGLDVVISDRAPNPAAVDYIIFAPGGIITDFTPFTRCKAVLNLWAGVEKFVNNPTLTQPLCRMVNHELTEGMVEYVVGHVLRHHLGMDAHIQGQDGVWRNAVLPPLARERPVAVLGMGALGQACAQALAALHFPVIGWSRSLHAVPGLACFAGPDGLANVLGQAQIVVLLMPLTAETTNIINAVTLAMLPRGAVIINPGRGALIDDTALLGALDSGQVGHATLDVFRVEPLPPDHPYWSHRRVTVTPHIAADTRVMSAARVLADNMRRGEAGAPFLYLVDRRLGY